MELVWTAYGQEPREICATPAGEECERPAPSARGGGFGVAMTRAVAAAGIGLLLLAVSQAPSRAPAPIAETEAPLAVGAGLAPLASLSLGGSHESAGYVARSRGASGERRDTLTLGQWADDAPYLSLTLRTDARPQGSFFVELATQSAQQGFGVLRSASPENFAGGRAPIEWARATLSGQGRERACAGFRLLSGGAAHISGFACGAGDAPPDRAVILCLIDALALSDAGRAAGLGAALPGAPVRRAACARGLV